MAKRVVKKKAKKAAKKPSIKVVDPKDLPTKPRRRRASKFDPIAEALLKNPKKAVVVDVPKGKSPQVYRTMLYTRLIKCLDFMKPNHNKRVSISILEDDNLGVVLK